MPSQVDPQDNPSLSMLSTSSSAALVFQTTAAIPASSSAGLQTMFALPPQISADSNPSLSMILSASASTLAISPSIMRNALRNTWKVHKGRLGPLLSSEIDRKSANVFQWAPKFQEYLFSFMDTDSIVRLAEAVRIHKAASQSILPCLQAHVRKLDLLLESLIPYPYLYAKDLHTVDGCRNILNLLGAQTKRTLLQYVRQELRIQVIFEKVNGTRLFPLEAVPRIILRAMNGNLVATIQKIQQAIEEEEFLTLCSTANLPFEELRARIHPSSSTIEQAIGQWKESAQKMHQNFFRSNSIRINGLRLFPKKWVSLFDRLEKISLTYMTMTRMPTGFSTILLTVKKLELSHNQLEVLPSLQNIKTLKVLQANGNRLSFVPSWIDELPQLERLDFSKNEISEIICNFSRSKNLQWISLGNNQLSQLPDLSNIDYLICLDVRQNQLKKIPDWIPSLRWLSTLDMSHNLISSIPNSTCTSRFLRSLNLAGNRISELTDNINEFTRLQLLDVSDNPLESYSAKILDLPDNGRIFGVSRCLRFQRWLKRQLCCY